MKLLFIPYLLWLLLQSLVSSDQEAKSNNESIKKPYAVLHIGPHKTGTTSLQHYLFTRPCPNMLKHKNYYSIPENINRANKNRNIAHALMVAVDEASLRSKLTTEQLVNIEGKLGTGNFKNRENIFRKEARMIQRQQQELITNYTEEIRYHRDLGHNIILSSEEFCQERMEMRALFSMLKGFRVHVLMVHRDIPNLLISLHNQLYKSESFTMNIEKFFIQNFLKRNKGGVLIGAADLARRYSEYVDLKNIHIFDFNGIKAAGLSLTELIFTHGFPGLSDKFLKKVFHEIKIEDKRFGKYFLNVRIDLRSHELFYIARNIAQTQLGLSQLPIQCTNRNAWNVSIMSQLPRKCIEKSLATLIVVKSLRADKDLRKRYSQSIINGDPVVNEKVIRSFSIEEINENFCWLDEHAIRKNEKFVREIKNYIHSNCTRMEDFN